MADDIRKMIDRLEAQHSLSENEYTLLLQHADDGDVEYLQKKAQAVSRAHFGSRIYIRGLIEFTNYCKNNCYYCGIRAANPQITRYRLTKQQILDCCESGYASGFRTFVLQGGEDPYFTDDILCDIVSAIKKAYADCAVTLSVGERGYESFARLKMSGADRYLLRHETSCEMHYGQLHPPALSFANRMHDLRELKALGFQTGCGFMVGSPGQTLQHLAKDFAFIQSFDPQMVGVGPFLPHHNTPFGNRSPGSLRQTLICLGLLRLMKPSLLLPATTALGTLHPNGRQWGILFGANVVMPNLSPQENRAQYALYDNKLSSGAEAAECVRLLEAQLAKIGYAIDPGRGDYNKKE